MGFEGAVVAQRFVIERLAGRGGMGSVYRSLDRTTGTFVALKILHGDSSRAHRERFAREAQLLAELTYPAFVRYIAHGFTDQGEPFLAMVWLDGEDLAERLRGSGLGAGESVRLARRVAEALGAAHARGVVHRDIKPNNLFLVGRDVDRVKILDFGIARVQTADGMTRTGATLGTPGYMAPEQARGSRDVDARADVFSLGCVLFQCLTGQPPFVGETAMAVLAKILLEDAPRLASARPDLPRTLDDLVARMLAKDPAARLPSGAAVATALAGIGTLDDAARPVGPIRDSAVTIGEQRLVCVVFAHEAVPKPGAADTPPVGAATVDTARTISDEPAKGRGRPGPSEDPAKGRGRPGPSEDQVGTAQTLATMSAGPLAALSAAVEIHGGRAEVLADGSVVVTVLGQGTATDQAARAARCALAVREVVPDAAMALASGRCVVGDRIPLGDLIDRAAGLLRAPVVVATGPTQLMPAQLRVLPIRVDEVSAGLLDIRFLIEGDASGLMLVGERDVADPVRTLLGKPTACVGRERELATLGSIFEEVAGEPMARVVVVTAAAGVGKSRVRHELLRRLDGRDVEILLGRGNPMTAGAPLAMLAQAIRRTAGIVESEPLALRHMKLRARVMRHVAPEDGARITEFLGELVGAPLPEGGSLQLHAARQDPQLMGDQMLRAFEDFTAAECGARPVVLVLEDLQWGDLPTVRFVDAIVRQLPDRPLMVLALARPEVDAVFPRLWAERNVERIHLAELTKRAAEKLARDVLGRRIDDATLARLVDRAAGNAFYLEELIRSVAEGKGDRLPETVVAMAQARIEGLEDEARHVLRAASVFGQVFWRGGVLALLDGGKTQVGDWLSELVAREMITQRRETRFAGDVEYTFRHALVREAAYAMLTDRDRIRGHRAAGDWLEARVRAERPLERAAEADAVALAEHFERGGQPRKSVGWYRQAAQQALEGDDLATAIDRADRAIFCVSQAAGFGSDANPTRSLSQGAPSLDDAERELVGLLRQLQSGAHAWRGEYALAAERGVAAMHALPGASGGWFLAAAAVAEACSRRLEHETVVELCRALAEAPTTGFTQRAYTYAIAMGAQTLCWHGDPELIARVYARLDRIELGADPATLAWICHARSWRALREGDLGACLVLDSRVVDCFTAVGDLRHACQQRANVGYDQMILGASAHAEASLTEAIAAATRIGLHQVTTQAQHNLGLVLLRVGRIDDARVVETAARDALIAQGNRRLAAAAMHYLAVIEIAAGNLATSIQHSRDAIDATPDVPGLRCQFHSTLATAYRLQGDTQAALAHATTAIRLMETHGRPEEGESDVRLAYAEALYATGAVHAAHRVIAEAKALVLESAAKIADPGWRRSFLESVPGNAGTLALAQLWGV